MAEKPFHKPEIWPHVGHPDSKELKDLLDRHGVVNVLHMISDWCDMSNAPAGGSVAARISVTAQEIEVRVKTGSWSEAWEEGLEGIDN